MKKNIVKTTAKALGFTALALALAAVPVCCWYAGHMYLAVALIYPCGFAAAASERLALEPTRIPEKLGRLLDRMEGLFARTAKWARN